MRQWPVDPGSVYQAMRLADPSAQRRLIARAEEIGKSWSELPATRQRTLLTALIERIDVGANRIDIHLRPTRLGMLLDIAATSLSGATDETQILSVRRGRPICDSQTRCAADQAADQVRSGGRQRCGPYPERSRRQMLAWLAADVIKIG